MELLIGVQNDESIKQHQTWEMDEEIQIFREYLRYQTVHPNINYGEKIFFRIPEVASELFVTIALKVHIIIVCSSYSHMLRTHDELFLPSDR